jgi:hypothetical protein
MDHSYEEIRAAALDVLAGREKPAYEATQYVNLSRGVAEAFLRRQIGEATALNQMRSGSMPQLSRNDAEVYLEVFWDLFRQGIITLGLNDSNPEFPFFHVSKLGSKIISNQGAYFFHDVSSYSKQITEQVPSIDQVTLLYLQEAMQAFQAGCLLSSSVMLGVAAEHTFYLLLDVIEGSSKHQGTFKAVYSERTVLQKFNKFKQILEQHSKSLSSEIKEDLDTHFAGILSIIRTFRNQSGHPTGKIVDREQAFVLLQLLIPYCKKLYLLMEHFKSA